MQPTLNISRRDILKGTLASLVGSISGNLPPAITTSACALLGPDTGLADILKEANVGYGAFYNGPVLQSVGWLAGVVRELSDPAQPSEVPCARLLHTLSCQSPGIGAPCRRFVHELLNLDQEGREAALAAIRAARVGIEKLRETRAVESEVALDIVAHVYHSQNCISDDGFPLSSMSPRECLDIGCADIERLFKEMVSKALTSLDAEEVLYREGYRLLQLGREYPVLGRALRCLQKRPYFPKDINTRLARESDAMWEPHRRNRYDQGGESAQSSPKLPPFTERGLINGILDGTIERYPREQLTTLLRDTLTPSNFATNHNDGLMSRLNEMGLVFCFDLTSTLWADRSPQVDMIWMADLGGYPCSFNLTYNKRSGVIAALIDLRERSFHSKAA